jgi:hypothetical protein
MPADKLVLTYAIRSTGDEIVVECICGSPHKFEISNSNVMHF